MVEIHELEAKIKEEETEKIWDSIDTEFLKECDKHRQWYLNFTKKEPHPMSYQVKKEIEEWTPDEFETFDWLNSQWLIICIAYMSFWTSIGATFLYFMFSH